MITHSHRLDMVPGGVPVVVNVSQYDDDFAIAFALYARTGTLTYPAGTTAEIRGTKTDGHAYSATAAVSNGVVTVSGHKQMTATETEEKTWENAVRFYRLAQVLEGMKP